MRAITVPEKGFVQPFSGGTWFFGRAVTTTSGTLSTATQPGLWARSPMTIVKVAATAGRYTIGLGNPYMQFLGGFPTLIGPDTATWGVKAKGIDWFFRDMDIDASAGSASAVDGTCELQFTNPSTDATNQIDSELPDGVIFTVCILVADGS